MKITDIQAIPLTIPLKETAPASTSGVATHSYFFGPGIAATIHLALSHTRVEYVEMHALPLAAISSSRPCDRKKGISPSPPSPAWALKLMKTWSGGTPTRVCPLRSP